MAASLESLATKLTLDAAALVLAAPPQQQSRELRRLAAPQLSAVMALFGGQLDKLKEEGKVPDEDLTTKMDEVRAEYDRQLDARFAAARGFVDEVVLAEELRPALGLLLRAARQNEGPHIGAFQIPPGVV